MADAQLVNERSFAIPRKIRSEISERHVFIRERSKSSVPDYVGPKSLSAEIYRTGDFEQRWRIELHVFERFPKTESNKKCFQIKTAPNLELGGITFRIPIATTCHTALFVAPLTVRDIQPLVVPFCGSGEISN